MGFAVPVMNESTNEIIYERNQLLNCGYEIGFSTQLSKIAFITARIIASLDFIPAV